MRGRNWIYAGAAFAGMGAVALSGLAQQRPDPVPPGQPWRGERWPDRWLDEVRNAPDPSTTVEAYSRARERLSHDGAAEHAYMHKMIDFGLPELAETQARSVAERRPRDGGSRAVLAYMAARRGDDPTAFQQIVLASELAPQEPFVLRTAGQLVAWLDTRADRRQIPNETLADVENMRRRLRNSPGFGDAYWRARRAYEDRFRDRRFGARGHDHDEPAIIQRGTWTASSADPKVCVGPECVAWRPAATFSSGTPTGADAARESSRWW